MLKRENIEAIYPLLEKQRALAFYSLQEDRSDPGFIQLRFQIRGPLNKAALERAWQALMHRHQSLRLTLQSPDNQKSMIVAAKTCDISIEWIDLSAQSPEEQASFIDAKLSAIRNAGIDLSTAPAHCLCGVQVEEELIDFFWACHHLFLDGWSALVLLNDLAQLYGRERAGGAALSPIRSGYGDYLSWLNRQSQSAGEAFWADQLSDYALPVYICDHLAGSVSGTSAAPSDYNRYTIHADVSLNAGIQSLTSSLKVTSASVVYSAWALYLGAIADAREIVFGTTTAGRAFDLEDSQKMTGYFANVVPKCFSVGGATTLREMMLRTHQLGFSLLPFEYMSLDRIQDCSAVPSRKPLFDNLVLFENLPQNDILLPDSQGRITLGGFSGDLTSTYPFTLTIKPGDSWRFSFIAEQRLFDGDFRATLELFPELLSFVCENSYLTEQDVLDWLQQRLPQRVQQAAEHDDVSAIDAAPAKTLARNSTELLVTRIWEQVLGVSEIDIHTEFQMLGGRSIAAVRMLALLEESRGVKISLIDLIRQPTIAQLAANIDGSADLSRWRSLIPLRAGGARPPLIFIHAVGSDAMFLRSITPYLDEQIPVIGLQLVGLDGECAPMDSIPEIAQHYLEEILTYQSQGPFFLVAHCLGAVVAFELMRKLKHLGHDIALFVVLDAQAPLREPVEGMAGKLRHLVADAAVDSLTSRLMRLIRKSGFHIAYLTGRYANKLRQRYVLSYGSILSQRQVHMELAHEASHHGFWSYFGEPVDQKIVLISSDRDAKPIHMEWQDLASDFEVIKLPIGHETMFMEPEVKVLGKQLNKLVLGTPV